MPIALSWKSFHESYIEVGVSSLHKSGDVDGAPILFVDSGARRIGLWLPCEHRPHHLPPSSNVLDISAVHTQGTLAIEVSTTARECYEAFYSLARDIVARRESGTAALAAVTDAIEAWRDLLRDSEPLTPEDEVGLWGELWFLRWLQQRGIAPTLELWTGPLADPHDFRVGGYELEIKTSTSPRRSHSISSLEQLQASDGHDLAVISMLIAQTDDGSGTSIRDLARLIREQLPASSQTRFAELLRDRRFPIDNDQNRVRSFVLRSEPLFVPVDLDFPALTRSGLTTALGDARLLRILKASYTVNLEGMGRPLSEVALFTT